MHVNKTKFEKKKQFSRVLSRDLYWENKTYKLILKAAFELQSSLIFETCVTNT